MKCKMPPTLAKGRRVWRTLCLESIKKNPLNFLDKMKGEAEEEVVVAAG